VTDDHGHDQRPRDRDTGPHASLIWRLTGAENRLDQHARRIEHLEEIAAELQLHRAHQQGRAEGERMGEKRAGRRDRQIEAAKPYVIGGGMGAGLVAVAKAIWEIAKALVGGFDSGAPPGG
jgi:hypothetical protein